jgi:benzoyl-CoA reductase/2-hydroxyglutaryl-CoA dehydratase subunit BcrC/BadD/HgdB
MNNKSEIKYYSISKKLKREKKITEEFEVMLNNLSLEEIIALKLELASKIIKGKLYGLNIYNNLPIIAKDAAVKYAFSACRTKTAAAAMLGISYRRLMQLQKEYNYSSFFEG